MKPKPWYFRSTALFGTPLRYGVPVCIGFTVLLTGLTGEAAIFGARPAAGSNPASNSTATTGGATPATTDAARANALAALNRTNQALSAARAMQAAARSTAIQGANNLGNLKAPLPDVPNGYNAAIKNSNGLEVAPLVADKLNPGKYINWTGADLPVQAAGTNNVTVKQTTQQALLTWQTFNVGKETTLTFDQTAGGENAAQWIAFNKVNDPSANPTQILGSIQAAGQVYIINTNGVIFGGSSQVNARNLTVSSLPINENLVKQGLLNNRDAQFLFSGLSVPGGSDGTPDFIPEPLPAGKRYGDVTVQAGAVLTSPASAGGNGGRIMLVGPNVTNGGTISTESGQTILAAGLQVAVAAHDSADASLRGLDVWVGALGDYAGVASNVAAMPSTPTSAAIPAGIIDTLTGSAWLAGRHVDQLGVINSSTSVSLNGRIDLQANYGAVANPNFDNSGADAAGAPMFFNQFTGVVTLGTDSVTSILPDYLSTKTVPGTTIERSQINITGLAIHFDTNSTLLAPNAKVAVQAGVWPYKDIDGNRTIFDSTTATLNPATGLIDPLTAKIEAGITNYYNVGKQLFVFSAGQIYVDENSLINVAGSADVFVPLAQSILTVQLRGPELADSPLQQGPSLRGKDLVVDIRDTGTYNGRYWVGTPLGDVTGLAGLIQRNAAQLTAVGGNITMQAGGSIVVSKGAVLDVSGGFLQHEGGMVQTSMLISNGGLVAIKNATPDQIYDGIYTPGTTVISDKWDTVDSFAPSLVAGTMQDSYVEGAAGGSLSLTAPGMALDGDLRGLTVAGPRQRSSPPGLSTLSLTFTAQKIVSGSSGINNYFDYSPTPPTITFSNASGGCSVPVFSLINDVPGPLAGDRLSAVILAPELLGSTGFGALGIVNPDGLISVPADITLVATPKGSLTLTGANISILGQIDAAGGQLSFTTYNISPADAEEFTKIRKRENPKLLYPTPLAGRGMFTLASGAGLSTAGLLVDDSKSTTDITQARAIDGGVITINAYNANLADGALIDVSGGAYAPPTGKISYGQGGTISVLTGKDPGLAGVIGGSIVLDAALTGYSGAVGGTLNIQAGLIRIGGTPQTNALNLGSDFFRQGGFTKYNLTGIGAASGLPPQGQVESYLPAIEIAPGTQLIALATSLIATDGALTLQRIVNSPGLRSPVSLSFTALGSDDPATLLTLEARGDILMGAGAAISTDAGASVTFKGQTVTLSGSVSAPGGIIAVTGDEVFPFTPDQRQSVYQALPTVHLGPSALLSTAGITQLVPDIYGRRIGKVYAGGKISIAGNILVQSGAVLDVSGASGVLDIDRTTLINQAPLGLITTSLQQRSSAIQVDSNGGLIDLSGSQMLLCDATLRGAAGGLSATGGTLAVFSGNYPAVKGTTSADLNLVVRQTGNAIVNPTATMGIGIGLFDQHGMDYGNTGYFAVDRFQQGGFASLTLGGKYLSKASPFPYGGNINFQGKIDIHASGTIRLAGGGVIQATDEVNIDAAYIAVGQDFQTPVNPDDPAYVAFKQDPAPYGAAYYFAPTYGAGCLNMSAGLIDVGTLSLLNIGHANLTSNGGDIRGNGTLSMAGDLVLQAAQVYPTSLTDFSIFAYDHAGIAGSVTIRSSGASEAPLSAGGRLSIYASNIMQAGVLRAPLGTIRLGWDGSDFYPDDNTLFAPVNLIVGSKSATPVTREVTLTSDSITSVSAKGLEIPFGISTDGLTWIDPRGVNVTLSGLPDKAVFVAADNVTMAAGATLDISGGGDLLASRWVTGNGGTVDLLGTASAVWGAGAEYQPGTLVTYNGATWSARVRNTGQTPGANIYWSKVAESYAIIPGFTSKVAPYGAYNTGANAKSLNGNPGNVSGSLQVGDAVTLEASAGLAAGTYTLLPRSYAVLQGAYLVTPVTSGGMGVIETADGASLVSGYKTNAFNAPAVTPTMQTRFEVAAAAVVKSRVTYAMYSANDFIAKADNTQLLPNDAGYAAIKSNAALQLAGTLITQAAGRGAVVDISSLAAIHLIGGSGVAPLGAQVVLQTSVLDSWGVKSLLIGGIRTRAVNQTSIEVNTNSLTLDNPGGFLTGPEITLVSRGSLDLTDGSAVAALGTSASSDEAFLINGDGALVRVSSDQNAVFTRDKLAGSSVPMLTIGASANITGASVILDSSYGTALSPATNINAQALTMGSGQISVVFGDATGMLNGAVINPHLNLSGALLAKAQQVAALTLHSYRSIDFYGTGSLGSGTLGKLTLSGSGLRGYQQGAGEVILQATDVRLENPVNVAALAAPATMSGSLKINAQTIHLGANNLTVAGYQNLALNASIKVMFDATGKLFTGGNLQIQTPLITGSQATTYVMTADQAVVLEHVVGGSTAPTDELGASLTIQGLSLVANSDILLPSGQLTLRATGGPLTINANLSVAGTARDFNDLTRFSDGGALTLESWTGDVTLAPGSSLSVAAEPTGGNAGILTVSAPQGVFASSGNLLGQAVDGSTTGSLVLDVNKFEAVGPASFERISTLLDDGGFFSSRNFRVRSGDVTIANHNRSHEFMLAADQGSILVTGSIDAHGTTGGSISLAAHNNLTLAAGSNLSVAATSFNSAGKGGAILLEAGSQSNGIVNFNAMLDLQADSVIDLSVHDYVPDVPGAYSDSISGSSASAGKFTGTLHLRAPRTAANNDVRVNAIASTITGASAVVVEGYQLYQPDGGILNIAQRDLIKTDATKFLGAEGKVNVNETTMRDKLLTGAVDSITMNKLLVISPGVEIVNLAGDLTLGLANTTGSTKLEALAAADWDLSGFRFGSRRAPGVMTMRASGNLIFNNTLSDGFTPISQGDTTAFADNGHSLLWLAPLMTIRDSLPVNTQSWSYRLTAGADTTASNFRSVLSLNQPGMLGSDQGSIIVGELYPAIPNSKTTGQAAAVGLLGQTADSIRISTTTANLGTRFEVIRTGTGDITLSAGRDVQLRNQFTTIYTAGVAVPIPTTVYQTDDFVLPVLPTTISSHPIQGGAGSGGINIGSVQQLYPAQWSMAGGNISISAQVNIGRYTLINGELKPDANRQMPTNWLYRRGYVNSQTGLFANDGGFGTNSNVVYNSTNINDKATSTTWWIDYSNFFQGVGTLGGGNITITAGTDIVNVDAVAPTNARMSGRMKNPAYVAGGSAPEYLNLAPDETKLLELGGGDVTVTAGANIDGGIYYVEKGMGKLFAGGVITTNEARSPSLGILDVEGSDSSPDPLTLLPTTLFVGKSHFDVAARGDVLLGPITNPFLLPQGVNNKYWYKTYFNTYAGDAGANVSSYGGDVTHRLAIIPTPDAPTAQSILYVWFNNQNLYSGQSSENNASNFQPWIRLAEAGLETFSKVFNLSAPNLRSTSFGGDVNVVGELTLFPSATGTLELVAAGNIVGLQDAGPGSVNGASAHIWTAATINLSDASPSSLPGITSPLAYQGQIGHLAKLSGSLASTYDILQNVTIALGETGSSSGVNGASAIKQARHGLTLLHRDDPNSVRLYATSGDITGLTLFSPKATRIIAGRDITDIAFYLQNTTATDVTLVSAGRDIIPFSENSTLRALANNIKLGNAVGDAKNTMASKDSSSALAGDIQINGPGVLEVLSGRNLDLGTGSNFNDGTGKGITSIGNTRNPNLPFAGAKIIAGAGMGEMLSLAVSDASDVGFGVFINQFINDGGKPIADGTNHLAEVMLNYPLTKLLEMSQTYPDLRLQIIDYLASIGLTYTQESMAGLAKQPDLLSQIAQHLTDLGIKTPKKTNYTTAELMDVVTYMDICKQLSTDLAALGLTYTSDQLQEISSQPKIREQIELAVQDKFDQLKLDVERRNQIALQVFYLTLRDAGRGAAENGNYNDGDAAVLAMFGKDRPTGEVLIRAREIRTTSGGAISLLAPGGGITMASAIFGNPLTPPGIVTEYGGGISTFTNNDVGIGQARIFTLRGGNIMMWSSNGNIAAGTAPKTVVTAPPTRVVMDITSADVQTDLGGLATGGGIGVLAAVEGVKAGNVDLIAPNGFVDAGDSGIRSTGDLSISARAVLNSSNISTGGTSSGATPVAPSAPSVASVTTASNSSAAANSTPTKPESGQGAGEQKAVVEPLSIITVEVIGYGGGSGDDEDKKNQSGETQSNT